MTTPRSGHRALLLADGTVLVTGVGDAERYDPRADTWSPTGGMVSTDALGFGRRGYTLTLLADGRVLAAGGAVGAGFQASAERYDPASGTWHATGAMATIRGGGHTATRLPDGTVLVAGGLVDPARGDTPERYDPATGTWRPTGRMRAERRGHSATLLGDGTVLVAGGCCDALGRSHTSAERYDPASGTWRATGPLLTADAGHVATLLPDGSVLALEAAPWSDRTLVRGVAQRYDPAAGVWQPAARMATPRVGFALAPLPDGGVLAAGGCAHYRDFLCWRETSAERYLPGPLAPPPPGAGGACRLFPETGRTVCGRFLEYWEARGGLAQQGYPLTDAFDERNPTDDKVYQTQYFERARFEYHPEHAPPHDVLLGLIGREQLLARYGVAIPAGTADTPLGEECATFPETGRRVCGAFLAYWSEHGGLAQQGLPLTDLILETNPTDGKQYPTQYFERARFEYHPEHAGTPYEVLLGLLGSERLVAAYPGGDPTAPPPPPPPPDLYPFRDDFADRASGWPLKGAPEGYRVGYADGTYRIAIDRPGARISVTSRYLASAPLTDVAVEVDVTLVSGDGTGPVPGAGIACRAGGADTYYLFLVRGDGQVAILKRVGGAWTTLAAGAGPAGALHPGTATNRLRAECVGETLALAANGQRLLEARDRELATGHVRLFAVSGDVPGTEFRFDNFLAARPEATWPYQATPPTVCLRRPGEPPGHRGRQFAARRP